MILYGCFKIEINFYFKTAYFFLDQNINVNSEENNYKEDIEKIFNADKREDLA